MLQDPLEQDLSSDDDAAHNSSRMHESEQTLQGQSIGHAVTSESCTEVCCSTRGEIS